MNQCASNLNIGLFTIVLFILLRKKKVRLSIHHEGQSFKYTSVSFIHVHLLILYVGREYQEIQQEKKLREINEGNVRTDTDHIEVNSKMKSLNLVFVVFFFHEDNDQK